GKNNIYFKMGGTSTINGGSGGSTVLYINANGLGIAGESIAATYKLDVNGNARVNGNLLIISNLFIRSVYYASAVGTTITGTTTLSTPLYQTYLINSAAASTYTITLPAITTDMVGIIIEFRKITQNLGAIYNVNTANTSTYITVRNDITTVNGSNTTSLLTATTVYASITAVAVGSWVINV
ncbi:MAG: hypothetical protein EBX50_23190, partial [Chitinophagia bacterium]|nr:hypothetical protein [Chitinophagia bacterium]